MGLEKHFPKPKDLNTISIKNFCDLIIEFMTDILGFKRIVIVGHSFGAIMAQPLTYYYSDVIAGVCINAASTKATHLGFLAYTNASFGVMADIYKMDWEYVQKNINDIDFQLKFQSTCKKEVNIPSLIYVFLGPAVLFR